MQIGLYANQGAAESSEEAKLQDFASLLTEGHTVFQVVPNIQLLRWEKVVWNAAWNSLTTLTMLDTHAWLSSSPSAMPMTRKLMTEVIDVARACGVLLEYELIDRLVDKILTMPPIGSSMQMDAKNGRVMEVEIILGTPVRKAKELGVDCPILNTLYTLLTGVNVRLGAK